MKDKQEEEVLSGDNIFELLEFDNAKELKDAADLAIERRRQKKELLKRIVRFSGDSHIHGVNMQKFFFGILDNEFILHEKREELSNSYKEIKSLIDKL